MQRNDLTSEELRFQRLLRSLDRRPAAPDAEFLLRLKEASTAAFIAAQPVRPRAQRTVTAPPLNPAVGRQRLRSLRVALFSSVAVLLILGMLPTSLFPSRGIELQVALDNLGLASSAEIEVLNNAGLNTMLFARSDDAALRWRVDYASGNAEVSDGSATYFLNGGRNSVHPSPVEGESATSTFVEDKLLASLNVDQTMKSSLGHQRPEFKVDQNGQRLYGYNFQVVDQHNVGETLTVKAIVNADTNTLVAMNSEIRDAAGRSKFKVNADVKSLNQAIPNDRFQVDPEAASSEQIAMVEDVQGQAIVDDLTPLPAGAQGYDGAANQAFDMQAMNGMGGQFAPGQAEREAVTMENGSMAATTVVAPNFEGSGLNKAESKAGLQKPGAGEKASAKTLAQAPMNAPSENSDAIQNKEGPGASSAAADRATAGNLKSDRMAAAPRARMLKSPAPVASPPRLEMADAAQASEKKQSGEPSEFSANAKDGMPVPLAAPMPAAPSMKKMAVLGIAGGSPAAAESQNLKGRGRAGDIKTKSMAGAVKAINPDAAEFGQPNAEALEQQLPVGRMGNQNGNFQLQEMGVGALGGGAASEAAVSNSRLQSMRFNPNVANFNQHGNNGRGGEYGLVRRQVAAQIELRPGGVLKTEEDSSNVVWMRLANDADLVLGPASEVLLLKPTEIRLQVGELLLSVPAGDQVDLLGPEPVPLADAENIKQNSRRGTQQLIKLSASRLQVTGRGVFRVENSQLQRVERDPLWLANYFAKQNASKQNAQPVERPEPK